MAKATGEFERILNGDAAMSFADIGAKLGITKDGAWMAYRSALRKLRRACNAEKLQELRDLASAMEQERQQ